MSQPLTNADQFLDKISLLEEMLQQSLPSYKDMLKIIHTQLKQDEDLVHILTDEQIGTIIAGLQKHKGIVVTAANIKAAGTTARKKGASLSEEDI